MKVDGAKLLEEFRRYLAEHSLPATQQRLAVAEAVFFAGEHLSAEEVGRRVAKRVAVGTATIYRTLDLLVRAGWPRSTSSARGSSDTSRSRPARRTSIASVRPAAR